MQEETERACRMSREIAIVYTIVWAVLSVSFWHLRDQEVYLPVFWPIWFAATAIICGLFTWKPQSKQLYIWSGAMGVVGFAGRVVGVMGNAAELDVYGPGNWRAIAIATIYALAAYATAKLWSYPVRMLHMKCRYGQEKYDRRRETR